MYPRDRGERKALRKMITVLSPFVHSVMIDSTHNKSWFMRKAISPEILPVNDSFFDGCSEHPVRIAGC